MAKQSQDFKSLPHATTRNFSYFARNFTLFSIFIMVIAVTVATVCVFVFQPKNRVEAKFAHLSTYYYEDILIKGTVNAKNFSGDLPKTLEKYNVIGFSPITLRQLSHIVHNEDLNSDIEYILKYCDDEGTYVKFYPEPPYSADSYRAEYTYTCNF